MLYHKAYSQDLSSSPNITAEQHRLNRLLFGSVVIFDHSIAFRVGRHPSISLSKITQKLALPVDVTLSGLTSPDMYSQ